MLVISGLGTYILCPRYRGDMPATVFLKDSLQSGSRLALSMSTDRVFEGQEMSSLTRKR